MAYDAVRREVVLFGGARPGSVSRLGDTWIYRTDAPADFSPFGSGCPGSVGTPALANATSSLPWIGDVFRTEATSVPASSGAIFVTGLAATAAQSLAAFGLPGCASYVTFDAVDFAPVVNGRASWSIHIPEAPELAGLQLFQQALVLDAGAAGGAVVSNAGAAEVGIR
jgi:hypothetical protein